MSLNPLLNFCDEINRLLKSLCDLFEMNHTYKYRFQNTSGFDHEPSVPHHAHDGTCVSHVCPHAAFLPSLSSARPFDESFKQIPQKPLFDSLGSSPSCIAQTLAENMHYLQQENLLAEEFRYSQNALLSYESVNCLRAFDFE